MRALDDLVTRAGRDAPYEIALVYAWRGDRDRAFEWLERAYLQHDIALRNVKVEPLLRGLHGDARFPALLREMGLPAD